MSYEYTGNTKQFDANHPNLIIALKVDPTADPKVTKLAETVADANGDFTIQWSDWSGRVLIGAVDDDGTIPVNCKFIDWQNGVFVGFTYSQVVLGQGPLAYYQFNETEGTTLADSSGNGYDLTLNNGTLAQPGIIEEGGTSLGCNTVDYANVPVNFPGLALTGDMTAIAWININSIPISGSDPIVTYEDSGETQNVNILYRLDILPSGAVRSIFEWGAGNNNIAQGGVLTLGRRFMLVMVRDSTNKFHEVTANLTSLDRQSFSFNAEGGENSLLKIGKIDGRLDELAIYNRRLSNEEIKDLHFQGVFGDKNTSYAYNEYIRSLNPKLYWALNDPTVDNYQDYSGNGILGKDTYISLVGEPERRAGHGNLINESARFSKAISGRGVSSRLQPVSKLVDQHTPFTVSMWFKSGAVGGSGQTFIYLRQPTPGIGRTLLEVELRNDGNNLYMTGYGFSTVDTPLALDDSKLHHLVATVVPYSGTNGVAKVYIDGAEVLTTSITSNDGHVATQSWIQCGINTSNPNSTISIPNYTLFYSEVALFDSAFDANQIDELYKRGLNRTYPYYQLTGIPSLLTVNTLTNGGIDQPAGGTWRTDDTGFFVASQTGNNDEFIGEYDVDGTFITKFNGTDQMMAAMHMKPDGTELFVLVDDPTSSFQEVRKFILTTPNTLVGGVTESTRSNINVDAPGGFTVSPDGVTWFFFDPPTTVKVYKATTPWDVSTLTFEYDHTISAETRTSTTEGDLFVDPTGYRMWVSGRDSGSNGVVHEYILNEPFDIRTSRYTGNQRALGFGGADGIAFNSDGSRFLSVNQVDTAVIYNSLVPDVIPLQFSASRKATGVTLSNNNLTMTSPRTTDNGGSALTDEGVTGSGKYYYEIEYTENVSGAVGIALGGGSTLAGTGVLFSNSEAFSYNNTGNYYQAGSQQGTGPSFGPGDVVGFLLDLDSGVVGIHINGADTGVTITGLDTGKTWCPAASTTLGASVGSNSATLRTAPQEFSYSIPSGYVAIAENAQ